jgi:hypothetical protein
MDLSSLKPLGLSKNLQSYKYKEKPVKYRDEARYKP